MTFGKPKSPGARAEVTEPCEIESIGIIHYRSKLVNNLLDKAGRVEQ